MKCHYEILDISRDADDSEIKVAYRKLALKWHPDKNLENTEYAKEQFQLVQQAYEVLSDRQERAWYDKHREQILRGSNSDYKDNNLDVFQYFTTTCFKGYGDDENGFYCTYGKVFEQIGKEDYEYMDNKEQMHSIPQFGNSLSDYEEVVAPFYDYWMSYSTKKPYVWLDPHNIKEATNRKIYKLIEKENEKIRQKAKKERNEEVRNLVAFVRKRDKRVQAYVKKLEEKKIENREKQKKITTQKRLERIKQLNESSEQGEWMKFDNVMSELEEIERKLTAQFGDDISESDDDTDTEELNHLYCIACNKIFKTPKAFKNHESSKKHRENVQNIKHAMTVDDIGSGLTHSVTQTNEEQLYASDSNKSVENNQEIENSDTKVKKKNKKPKNVIEVIEHNSDVEINNGLVENDSDKDQDLNPSKKQKRKRKRNKQGKKDEIEMQDDGVKDKEVLMHENSQELDKDHSCAKCKQHFPSKNKLFEHLKKTGHSCYLNAGNSEKGRKNKGIKQK